MRIFDQVTSGIQNEEMPQRAVAVRAHPTTKTGNGSGVWQHKPPSVRVISCSRGKIICVDGE